ncbi:phosphomannomutase [Breznakia sp. PF5-3]|uniref:phosphomannomutase/phosphoglucomutase n=1 Tax=unclassified Breznakia TaxID=2623764 RepID=UPI00240705C2|nr:MULTISPECIES: phosphomannomutase/phosphoglucomutase [unclassified Breznakia]MDF9824737.1 phosphomannomutase [Breznakia sp. PM6-1]MDF9835696.1 phosphomannomutase [Breznakia sp. PF5-3]MDF9837745.1 phosphomannomutase [Breznakia sp. PFB2-8]MDF9859706.1 phosphomannomutase [Breznakia sp. PH5-24]
MDLLKLQNGSDIRGVAVDGVEGEPITLTADIVYAFAKGFAKYLQDKTNKEKLRVAVGHDSRISADDLKHAVCQGLSDSGCLVYDCGLASTPSMFMSTLFEEFQSDGAIMITASHLPFNRNGMKFFDKDGGLNKKDITTLITHAKEAQFLSGIGNIEKQNLLSTYSQFLVDTIRKQVNDQEDYDKPLKGMKIIVDAGNGAGGFYAEKVLSVLGADITGSQFLEPDGMFPNHIPNPENKEAMAAICNAVKKNHADLGLIFDTDVDRSSAVDRFGNEISRNAIVALSAALVSEDHPATTIVTDSVTSDELHTFLEEVLKVKHLRYQRGYKNVINKAIELNDKGIDCQLAIETSGHAALKENYFLDDGAYLATKIVIKAAKLFKEEKYIDELISELKHPLEEQELRFQIKNTDFSAYGDDVLKALEVYSKAHPQFQLAKENYEGLRFSFDKEHGNGWFLLRKSLHDPIMALNIESNTKDGCKSIAKQLLEFLKEYDGLDVCSLVDFIK